MGSLFSKSPPQKQVYVASTNAYNYTSDLKTRFVYDFVYDTPGTRYRNQHVANIIFDHIESSIQRQLTTEQWVREVKSLYVDKPGLYVDNKTLIDVLLCAIKSGKKSSNSVVAQHTKGMLSFDIGLDDNLLISIVLLIISCQGYYKEIYLHVRNFTALSKLDIIYPYLKNTDSFILQDVNTGKRLYTHTKLTHLQTSALNTIVLLLSTENEFDRRPILKNLGF